MPQSFYTSAQKVLVLVSPSKGKVSSHLSKNMKKSEVCASDPLHYPNLLQCWGGVLDNYHQYSMSFPSCLLSHIQILVM